MKLYSSHFLPVIEGLRDAALAMLYPTACRVCGKIVESWQDGIACEQCWQDAELSFSGREPCIKCGIPLKSLPSSILVNERCCGQCDDRSFGMARACGVYDGAIRESVLWLKHWPQITPRLREFLGRNLAELNAKQEVDSIVPVPLHPKRLAERNFNQSEVIARELAAISGLPLDTASLVRVRHTERHRVGMAARERARSMEKAFRVRAPRLIEGKVLLVVDDVMTTGSTADAISQVLLAGGARAVYVLTLARAASEFL